MIMFSLFGLLGLVIAAVGVFGVIAYLVSQPTRAIGIRLALGATQSRIATAVLGQTGALVVAGLIVVHLAGSSVTSHPPSTSPF